MYKIEVKNLSFSYENFNVLNNFSEDFNPGEVYVIMGRSGCGMTTLLKIIAGLIYYESGSILIGGRKLEKFSKKEILEYHKLTGFVFQQLGLISNMSIKENLSLLLLYHSNMKKELIEDIVLNIAKTFEFDNFLNNRPTSISIGNIKLINLARAIIHDPFFIFMDEPDSNLDNITMNNIVDIILKLKEKKKLIVIGTHNINFAKKVGDYVGILNEGKIIERFTPENIGKTESNFIKKLIE